MNILITSAARKVLLVQAFKKALREEALQGYESGLVIAGDSSPDCPAPKFSDIAIVLPSLNENNPEGDWVFFCHLLSICEDNKIKLIVPTRDGELGFFANFKWNFDTRGIRVAICEADTVKLCQDKIAFADFCEANGFSIPQRISDVTSLPVFVRPRQGYGSGLATRVDTMAELAITKRRLGECIVQENIFAPEYTVDVFCDEDSKVISVIPRQRIRVVAGESVVSRTEKNADLMRECQRMAEALKLKYHSVIQCFYDNGVVKFIEVNPRYGGASNCSFVAGGESPKWLIQMVNGRKVTTPPMGKFIDNLTMLRYSRDIFIYPDERYDTESTEEEPVR